MPFGKKIEELNSTEITFMELERIERELNLKLQEIQQIVNDIYSKLLMSHCTLVVRKIGEDKIDDLKKILD